MNNWKYQTLLLASCTGILFILLYFQSLVLGFVFCAYGLLSLFDDIGQMIVRSRRVRKLEQEVKKYEQS
jgi:hypothetical protein